MHGFNRLGGNSVAETVVSGMLVSEYVADFCGTPEGQLEVSTALAQEILDDEQAKLDRLLETTGSEHPVALRKRMEQVMMEKVGLFRNGPHLEEAVDELQDLLRRSRKVGVCCRHPAANPELVLAYRLPKMLKMALGVALGALRRTESRGAHFREDHPERNDRGWLKRTLFSWPGEDDELPRLDYEPLDVKAMELPPGFRGYGARNILDHPDTAERQAQVDDVHAGTPDRYAAQDRLMPFRHLLPERYRGNNERLSEPQP
jgi:fumarate reductase flavoprotein subunit